jgi:reductive dehalogenase
LRKLTLEEWEKKYIPGPEKVEQWNEKNIYFNRLKWDPAVKHKDINWPAHKLTGKVTKTVGDSAWEHALRFASAQGEMLSMIDFTKPNPPRISMDVKELMEKHNYYTSAQKWRPPEPIDVSDPVEITKRIKKAARHFGADLVGICKLDRRWVNSHTFGLLVHGVDLEEKPQVVPEEYQYGIVMAYEEDYNMVKHFNKQLCEAGVMMGYARMAICNLFLAAFIQALGFKAIDCAVNQVAQSVPMAMQAGLGELGRHGLMIAPKYGSRIRLTKVLTNMPLVPDQPIEFGVTEFCNVCKKCAKMCPSQSISYGERSKEVPNISGNPGALKWAIDMETCTEYWIKIHRGCGICMSVCPYDKVNSWPHRTVQWFTENAPWLDPLFVWGDDLLGYGKVRDSANFWDEWKPEPYGHTGG